MLLHDNLPKKVVSEVAEKLWYPLWDANIRLDHSVRTVPEAMKVAGRGHLGRAGDAGGAPHRGRRRPVVAVGRRCASAVAHRNRLALRRTRRTHPAAVAAQRPDRPPRRARPQDRPRRAARRPAAQRAGDRPTGRRLPEPVAGVADRDARRGAPGAAQRPHRAAPRVRPRPRPRCWPSTPTRSARRCASATDSIWRACSPTPPARSASTSTPACAPRRMRCRAADSPRSAGRCADRSTRASSSSAAR